MTVTIHTDTLDYDRRSNKTIVYVQDTKLHKIADAWFTKNNLYSFKVRSKAWRKIVRHLNGVLESHIADHFKIPVHEVRYSVKAGCSCGCSPGFNIKSVKPELRSRNIWIQVQVLPHEVHSLQSLIESDKFQSVWQKDLHAHAQVHKQVPACGS